MTKQSDKIENVEMLSYSSSTFLLKGAKFVRDIIRENSLEQNLKLFSMPLKIIVYTLQVRLCWIMASGITSI